MIPEKNGITLRFVQYGNKYARADVYRLKGFGYAFVCNFFYGDGDQNVHADVDAPYDGDVLEKALLNQPHVMVIVPDHCVRIYNPWGDQGLEFSA